MRSKINADFLVLGAGVIGVNVALNLVREYPDANVIIIDKEKNIGAHASGRNSGVLHAGFYYSENSLKAKFTRDGNRMLTNYCLDNGLAINQCGKLVVAKNENDLSGLDILFQRGEDNGIELNRLDEYECAEIEPRAKTFKRALFSPFTSSINPMEVMNSFCHDLKVAGVQYLSSVTYLGYRNGIAETSFGKINANYIINCAGLYADKIAHDFGFSNNYKILPFKGIYLNSNEPVNSLRVHVYPVPDLKNPFLGVHFTVSVDGKVKIGPTATMAFWRENYRGLSKFKMNEFLEILYTDATLFINNNFGFKRLAFREVQKYSRLLMTYYASHLVKDVKYRNYQKWGRPGIRAQLLNVVNRKLEMDFICEGDDRSFHILNAVSPAFTCSMSFSIYVVSKIKELIQ